MQIIFNDKTVRSDTVPDLKVFNLQSPTTQPKKGEQLVSLMPAIKKAFDLMVDDIMELSTENENKLGSYDEEWKRLDESQAKLLEQIDDDKRSNLIMSRMKEQMNKQY